MHVDHSENIVEVKDVSFGFNRLSPVIRDITLAVHRGDYLGVIGPNGGGKTTLLRVMLGLLKPTTGSVRLFGQDIRHFKDWFRIGYVPQKAAFIDAAFPATVEEVVTMGTYAKRGLFRMTTKQDRARVHEALERVEMQEYRNRLIGDLSGGQQQRVLIARALAAQPEVIFLDEPTVGVDVTTQEHFYRLLRRLNREFDLTLVLISHELDVVAHETTEIAFINGTLVSYRTAKELARIGGLQHLYGAEVRSIQHNHPR